jgi:predicted PurR-regulated permease PerM
VVTLAVFRHVLVPFVVAVVLAYLMMPAVEWIVLRIRLPRWLAVIALYIVLLGALGLVGVFMVPRILSETGALVRAAPGFFLQVKNEWVPAVDGFVGEYMGDLVGQQAEPEPAPCPAGEPAPRPRHDPAIRILPLEGGGFEVVVDDDGLVVQQVADRTYRVGPARAAPQGGVALQRQIDDAIDRALAQGEQHVMTALRWTQRALFLTVGFVFEAVLALMLAAFILATGPSLRAFFRSLFPPRLRDDFDQVVKRIDGGLSGVIRGQILICLLNGVLSGIGFGLARLPYWPLLTLLATVASLVPIFGTIASSVPAILVGLSQGWGTGLFVVLWIVGIHELEANVLNPKIMGDAAKMHPVVVVFALLAGAHAAGLLGALLGVPVASILQSLFRHLRARVYEEDASGEACTTDDVPVPDLETSE